MNTTRIINQKPNLDITPEDMLYTNVFIPSIENTEDLTKQQKESFKRYMETVNKNKEIKKVLDTTDGEYDYFASTGYSSSKNTTIDKNKRDVIKIEKPSIIDIDTRNRDKNLYPQPSSFIIPLGKTFYNIKSIELVSTAIPNTDQTITNTPIQIRNNRISWENYEDQDLGIYLNRIVSQVGDYLHINIPSHGLEYQIRNGNFYIKISKSTTIPSINGKRYAEIVDSNTIRIPFIDGITTTGTADIDTGVPNYTVELTPGNYTATTIATEIQKQMNLIKRRNGTSNIFHYFNVSVNLDTDVMTFRSYITKQLQGSPLSTVSGSGLITVTSISHGFKSGDYVLIISAKSTGGLSNSVLNGLFLIDVLNSDSFVYEVNERASETGIGGGTTCKTGQPSDFRLIFDTSESLIVDNIGFPGEDSSEKLGTSETPITTKTISPSSASKNGDYLSFTANTHGLSSAKVFTINNVTVGNTPILTTSMPHELGSIESVYLSYGFTTPVLEGFYSVTATSDTTFRLNTVDVTQNTGGSGILKHSGDLIKLLNFKSVPSIVSKIFMIENSTSNTFEVKTHIDEIDFSSLDETIICTNQLFITHPNHGFNTVTSIQQETSTTALVTTKVNHGLSGFKYLSASKQTNIINTVDITMATPHGLVTSDKVLISNSVGGADIGGTYVIQVITAYIFRITFVGGSGTGTCDVNIGDTVLFTESNSVPNISSNNLGVTKFYVEYISASSFRIETGFSITTPGTYAVIGRDNHVTIHRATASEPGGSSIGGIPLTSINSQTYEIQDIIDINTYMLRVNDYATFTTSSGGSSTVLSSSEHGKKTFQSNTFDGTDTGVLYKSISLEGENYLYMTSPGLQTVFAPGNEIVGDIFSRIVLSEPPGHLLFDTFVSVPKEFNPPLRSLKEISLEIKRSDGILFNFNDMDYSASLKIVEIIDRIADTEFSSTTGTSDLYK